MKRKKPLEASKGVNWQVGDIAGCVEADFTDSAPTDPKVGDKLMVSGLDYGCGNNGYAILHLRFIGKPEAYESGCFRKIILTDTGADRKAAKTKPVKEAV